MSSILRKLGANGRVHAATVAERTGLLSPTDDPGAGAGAGTGTGLGHDNTVDS